MEKLFIKSNTKGKTLKMLEGKTFDSPLTFITELIQNTQRAKAKRVNVYIEDNTFTIKDDGVGMKKPQSLLTFDYSEWKSTSEGFGIGFWSILGIPRLEEVVVKSNNFILSTTRDNIIEDLSFNIEEIAPMKGFEVILTSSYFAEHKDTIIEKLKEELKLMSFDSYVNDKYVEKVDLKSFVSGDFMMDFDNQLFSARLAVSSDCYNYPTYYYEKRKVCIDYNSDFVQGIIELKKVDLKEPDRKSIIYNDKKTKIDRKLKECIITLYKEFIATITDKAIINLYEEPFARYLSPKDYENCLTVNEKPKKKEKKPKKSSEKDIIIKNIKAIIEEDNQDEVANEEEVTNQDETTHDNETVETKKEPTIKEILGENKKQQYIVNNDLISYTTESISKIEAKKTSRNTGYSIKDFVRQNKNLIYVNSNEVTNYEEAIGLCEYYGLKVFICENKLYEKYFTTKNIPHISEIEGCIINNYRFNNEGCKNNKEATFINLLKPIIVKFDLPDNLFVIAEIEKDMEVIYNDKVLLKTKIKNHKDNIQIFAVKQYDKIVLDRRAIALKNFSIKEDNLGIHEFKALMYNVNTIAHELAHYIYGTKDNTAYHFKMENYIQQEIMKLYCLN